MSSLFQDLRFAWRSFARTPAVTLLAVATLALGVGANSAIFSVVHSVLIDPLPYPHSERVVIAWRHNPQLGDISVSPAAGDIQKWRQAQSLEAITGYRRQTVVLSGGNEPEQLVALSVDQAFLDFTGSTPVLGRRFNPDEWSSAASARVVLLTHDLWTRRFGADRNVAGRTVELSDASYVVVGVLPASFRVPLGKADVLMPLPPQPPPKPGVTRADVVAALGRLRPGVSIAAAQSELNAIGVEAIGSRGGWAARLVRPAETTAKAFRRALLVLFGAVGFVLLIACANVANIVLARNAAREREIAVRAALGAGRWRLVRQMLTENLLLAGAGGGVGLLLGLWGVQAIAALRPPDMRELETLSLRWEMLGFGLAVSALTGMAFGIFPALAATRGDTADTLRQGSRSTGDARGRFVRRALSVAEVALALMLLTGAGLLIRSYARLQSADLGFDPARLIAVSVGLPESRYATPTARAAFLRQLAERLSGLAGVRYASLASGLPPRGGMVLGQIDIEGRQMPEGQRPGAFGGGWVGPGYFEAMRIPIREGRAFTDDDLRSEKAIVINEVMARRYFPGESAIGKRLRLNQKGDWSTIVGVVGAVRSSHADEGGIQIYFPLTEAAVFPDTAVLVATSGDPAALIPAIKGQVWSLDPKLPLREVTTIEQRVAETLARPRFNVVLLSIFATLGLLLAAIGIYGVISYSVGMRTREIGVRMALGALPADIKRGVLGEAMALAGLGAALGVAGSLLLSRLMRTLLFEVSAWDPWTLSTVTVVLTGAALLAAWLPARRAMRVDPMVALRVE